MKLSIQMLLVMSLGFVFSSAMASQPKTVSAEKPTRYDLHMQASAELLKKPQTRKPTSLNQNIESKPLPVDIAKKELGLKTETNTETTKPIAKENTNEIQ